MKQLVLASTSPRRKQVLEAANFQFTIVAPPCDEDSVAISDPLEMVIEKAKLKALSAFETLANSVVIGSDCTVVIDGKKLEKPGCDALVREYLHALNNRTHEVYTGVSIVGHAFDSATQAQLSDAFADNKNVLNLQFSQNEVSFASRAAVTFRKLSPQEIEGYVRTGDGLDKAGGYGFQSAAGCFVKSIEGDYYAVVGFPICPISVVLRAIGY